MYTGFACKETGYWLGIFTISLVVSPLPGHAWAKVKFVPHSTCLTEVLRQSRGNVMAWLSQHKPKSMTVESATWFQMVFRFIISTSFRSFARTWSLCRKMPPKNLAFQSIRSCQLLSAFSMISVARLSGSLPHSGRPRSWTTSAEVLQPPVW